MNEDENWDGKKAKIEILKDGHPLFYTASKIIIKEGVISFDDRTGARFGFSTKMVAQIQEINGGRQ